MITSKDFYGKALIEEKISSEVVEKIKSCNRDDNIFWTGFLFRDLFVLSAKFLEEKDIHVRQSMIQREAQQTYDCMFLIKLFGITKWWHPLQVLVRDVVRRQDALAEELKKLDNVPPIELKYPDSC